MSAGPSPEVRELLEWLALRPRTYAQTMEAWRSHCPRATAWEDATLDGLVEVRAAPRLDEAAVALTPRGRAALEALQGGAAPDGADRGGVRSADPPPR